MESHEQDEVVGRSKMCPRERAAGMKVGMGGCLKQRSRAGAGEKALGRPLGCCCRWTTGLQL